MKLLRYGAPGAERPGLLDADGTIRDLSGIVSDIDGAALSPDSLTRLAALDPATLPAVDGSPRIGSAIAQSRNYRPYHAYVDGWVKAWIVGRW